MRIVVILALLSVATCEAIVIADQTPSTERPSEQSKATSEFSERKLGQIVVEEEKKRQRDIAGLSRGERLERAAGRGKVWKGAARGPGGHAPAGRRAW